MKNDVWDIVPKPENKSGIFKIDLEDKTCCWWKSIEKYKARFVARWFSHKEGIDYEETFAAVARYTSIITIMVLSSMMKWDLHQMDVNTTFLNGMIEEEFYIKTTTRIWSQR